VNTRILAVAWMGLLVTPGAGALDIPALAEVQPRIAAAHPELAKQRDALLKERKALLDRTNRHNQSCREVEEGSAAEASCSKALTELNAAINGHVQASKQYNERTVAVGKLAASQQPAPVTDSSVVDARKVPSGLSKDLDGAIAGGYANAPPGVEDRVRKGFQAVMERDWKVAKAWFQDALNRDPGNAGLKRLVDLADSSSQFSQQPGTPDSRNEPAGLGGKRDPGVQLPDPNDIYLLFPGLKAMEDKEALDYLFGLDPYPPSSKSAKPK